MTPDQHAALLRLIGGHQGRPTHRALLLVLAGTRPADAAREVGIGRAAMSNVLRRAREVVADVRALEGADLPAVLLPSDER